MSLTKATPEVIDIPKVSIALAQDAVVGGIKKYVDANNYNYFVQSAAATAKHKDFLFVDTSGGAFTINLPTAPALGDEVVFNDVAGQFATNSLTIGRNGQNIMGLAENMIVDEAFATFRLVFSNATHGWRIV